MKSFLHTFLCVVFFVVNHGYSQTTNFDFELTSPGAYTSSTAVSGWTVTSQTNTGSCNNSTVWTAGSPEFSIVATPILSFQTIGTIANSPLGGLNVARLNNSISNSSTTKLSRTFSVTSSSSFLQFAFAGIWEDGGHSPICEQTSFVLQLKNQSGTILACNTLSLSPGTGGQSSGLTFTTTLSSYWNYWTNWQVNYTDLTPYINSILTMEIISKDCIHGDHFGTLFCDAKLGNSSQLIGSGLPTYSTSTPSGVSFCPGSAAATIQGPLGYASYSWTAPSSSYISPSQATLSGISVFNPIPGLTFTLQMTTMSGCTYVIPYTLYYTTTGIAAIGSSSTCSSGTGGSSTVVATGSFNGYTYSWINSTNSVVGTASVVNNLTPGIYTVNVTAGSCGSAVATTTVGIEPTPLTSIVKPFCNGQIFLSYPGGSNYQWYYNQTAITASLGGTASGYTTTTPLNQVAYVVSYDNAYGCRDSLSILLFSAIPGSVSISSNPLSCPGSTNGIAIVSLTPIAITPNGTNSFSVFSLGSTSPAYSASLSPTSSTTFTATNLTAGVSYSVKAFDGSCNYSTTFSVTPFVFDYTLSPQGSPTLCLGNSIAAAITFTSPPSLSQYTYSWSPGTFLFGTTSQVVIATPTTQPGSSITIVYTVVVTPSLVNCPLTKTLALAIANPLTPTITPLPAFCNNTNDYTISAFPTGGVFSDYSGAVSLNGILSPPLAPLGLSSFTYANSIGTCVAKSSASYSVNNAPVISIAGNTMICEGQSTTLLASGANSYSWSNSVSSPFTTLSPASSTTYTVIGNDAITNCSAANTVTVVVMPIPTLSILGDTLLCAGETTSLTATGAGSYSWSNGSPFNSIIVTPGNDTTYMVTGTNNQTSCSAAMTIFVKVLACTGIDELQINDGSLSAYPNPVSDYFVIDTPFDVSLIIMDGLGKLLLDKKIVSGKHNIDLQNLAAGVYLVTLRNGKEIKTLKLVKTN